MRKLLFTAVLAIGGGSIALAGVTDELQLSSGASTTTITDNGLGDSNPAVGTITWSGSINGWNVSFTSGTSNSPDPGPPSALDLGSLVATCSPTGGSCSADPLTIMFTDTGFTPQEAYYLFGFSSTILTSGTADGYAYMGTSAFDEAIPLGELTLSSVQALSVTTPNPGGGTTPYSLTLETVLSDTNGQSVEFSTDAALVGVPDIPEPSAVMLLGTVLLACGLVFRRRLRIS